VGVALLASVLTGLATALGAVPFLFVRELPRRLYDGILGLGAGLMLAAATLGLLSEALSDVRVAGSLDVGRLLLVVLGFATGVALVAAMDRLIPHRHAGGHHQHLGHQPGHDRHDTHEAHEAHEAQEGREGRDGRDGRDGHEPSEGEQPDHDARRGYAVVGALSLHRIPEGLAIGAGFAVTGPSRLGLLLAIAVGLQNVCEGIVMAAPLRQGGVSALRGLLVVGLTGMVIPVAAFVGLFTAEITARSMPFILALAGGTLIYITSNEIIPESHSHGHEGTASSGVVLGFLFTMVLRTILP
jgi:ZIP family zinc transporter